MLNGSVWCIFAIPAGYGSFRQGGPGAPPWTHSPPSPLCSSNALPPPPSTHTSCVTPRHGSHVSTPAPVHLLVLRLRTQVQEEASIRSAVLKELAREEEVLEGRPATAPKVVERRANLKLQFPELRLYEALKPLHYMQGMVDLEQVVVVTGFSEIGPWGNARTRWEMEKEGKFSLEGCIEMAWLMGLVTHFKGMLPSGEMYSGWVDSKTKEKVWLWPRTPVH